MWLTAITIGLAGSLHCIFMCSPLAMAATSFRNPFFFYRLVYNAGRILTYGFLGMFISSFGTLFQLSGFQNSLSLLLGGILIVFGISGIRVIKIPVITTSIQKLTTKIKSLFAVFLKQKTFLSTAFLGMLNGLLPCGLTYLALTYCITLPSVSTGFLFMIVFGAGTLPVMLGLTSFVQPIIARLPVAIGRLTTYMMIGLGVLLMTRSIYAYHNHSTNSNHHDIVICR